MASVDVLLPTHARPFTLGYAIESVLAQTHGALTLHVIGDGCGEETETVVRSFRDARVRFHPFPKARGVGYRHRNLVLRQTDAPFIAYATDDDLWLPDHLELALAELETRALDHVAFRPCHVKFPDRFDPFFMAFDLGASVGFPLRRWFMGSLECVHRRSALERAGYWNEHLFRFGDREFYARVSRSVPSAYVNIVTTVRFYAADWDRHYQVIRDPPQKQYRELIADKQWRAHVRRTTSASVRGAHVRMEQAKDFIRFGAWSAPKLIRLAFELRHQDRSL